MVSIKLEESGQAIHITGSTLLFLYLDEIEHALLRENPAVIVSRVSNPTFAVILPWSGEQSDGCF